MKCFKRCYISLCIPLTLLTATSEASFALYKQHRTHHITSSSSPRRHANTVHQNSLPSRGTRSTSDPEYEGGCNGNAFALGRERRRSRLHNELAKLGIDPNELETQPESFGTAAIRTFNSFLLPKSPGALAVAESPTRAKVVANSISFLLREHKANQERWIQNVDKNRARDDGVSGAAERITSSQPHVKHPITLILDNVRSAHNVGNILRLAEASQVDSVRLCGMTPRPPHPKVLKTAMGAAELVSLGDSEASLSTLQTVLELKSEGVTIIGVETTENSTTLWDANIPAIDDSPVAYIFGNELIGVGECLF